MLNEDQKRTSAFDIQHSAFSIPMRCVMRKQLQMFGLVLAALVVLAPGAITAREGDAKAASIMAESRKALGGGKGLSTLNALSLRAEFTREMAGGGPAGAAFVMVNGGGAGGGGAAQMSGSLEID